jgi:two-component system chemotaxis sensor kinase CheA
VTVDLEKFGKKLAELSEYSNNKTDAVQTDSKRFDVFIEKEEEKATDIEEKMYHITIGLNEKRIENTWLPEDLIDDIYKSGEVEFIKGTHAKEVKWETADFSQCHFEWEIIVKTVLEIEKICEIFLFFEKNNKIEINLINENTITEVIKKLIDSKTDDAIVENVLSSWEKLIAVSMEKNGVVQDDENVDDLIDESVNEKSTGLNDELKISSGKVNRLIDLVGELIIANSNLDNIKMNNEIPGLDNVQQNINNISRQLRDLSLSLKMVPIGQLLGKFRRMVSDLSREFGKEIELLIEGENTEVDKNLFSVLEETLLHIIRNSIDHGIEKPEERVMNKKNKSGKIIIKAYHENEQLVLEISDDGKGLDRDRILKKGIEKKLIKQGEKYSDDEIYKLIFESGFSTSDNVNLVSGRGIGMDIVKSELLKVNGSIKIFNVKNQGVTFKIQLPLTLAIIEGFLIRIGVNFFVIPLNFILECFEINFSNLLEKKMVHNFRGKYLNIINLDDVLINIAYDDPEKNNIKQSVVIDIMDETVGIMTDEIFGNIQVVVRPVTKNINQSKLFIGSTLLGNGEVALIIDVRNLLNIINNKK